MKKCGVRFFDCIECGLRWESGANDCTIDDIEPCPHCLVFNKPLHYEFRPNWEVDTKGEVMNVVNLSQRPIIELVR